MGNNRQKLDKYKQQIDTLLEKKGESCHINNVEYSKYILDIPDFISGLKCDGVINYLKDKHGITEYKYLSDFRSWDINSIEFYKSV
jgi:hypothetical protein